MTAYVWMVTLTMHALILPFLVLLVTFTYFRVALTGEWLLANAPACALMSLGLFLVF